MGSTPNSARWASIRRLFLVVAVELRPEEIRRLFQDLIGALEFSVLLLRLFEPLRVGGRHPGHHAFVDVGLAHPSADRLDAGWPRAVPCPGWCPARCAGPAPSAPRRPSPWSCSDASWASPQTVPSAYLHPRFQGQEPPTFPGRFKPPTPTVWDQPKRDRQNRHRPIADSGLLVCHYHYRKSPYGLLRRRTQAWKRRPRLPNANSVGPGVLLANRDRRFTAHLAQHPSQNIAPQITTLPYRAWCEKPKSSGVRNEANPHVYSKRALLYVYTRGGTRLICGQLNGLSHWNTQ
ncbi:hypothetical protein Mycch_4318 [Mycolicibacterium chubuense NBB4]|uniref:Uncharacterized protein n=1 Tax=Mycolicibacterium chubuense (strain NBB4) TaxID=710421 RepID=I4BP21_MYCCN|nr:hypothetical protein Mycch_4318 [Mycolicibacterium chubuense NBB4]